MNTCSTNGSRTVLRHAGRGRRRRDIAGPITACILFPAMLCCAPRSARADTVFLKNGSLIDGVVTHRTEQSILLQIGSIGKLEIPIEEIYIIEKNKRIGGELLHNSLDTRLKVEVLKERTDVKAKETESAGEQGEPSGSVEDVEGIDPENPDDPLEIDVGDGGDEGDEDAAAVEDEAAQDVAADLDPELKKRIEDLIADLDREQSRYRVRAERHLKAIGRPSIPLLLPLAESPRDLTRIAILRLFLAFGDDRVIEACVGALLDVNEYVRDYANRALIRITGEDFGFSAQASPRRRELAHRKWEKWWEKEESALESTRKAARESLKR